MKKIIVMLVAAIVMGCHGYLQSDENIKAFLPGTYVSIAEGEFSKAVDTLLIRKVGLEGNTYTIIRKVSFQRIRQGILWPKEYQHEEWIGIYDEKDKVLHETKRGRTLTYIPEMSKLFLGSAEYQKVQ
jgi:hypothetical protein